MAAKYELAGGAIVNVVRHGAIKALTGKRTAITKNDIMDGIRKEMLKEGRTM
jgi:hypothetical protein